MSISKIKKLSNFTQGAIKSCILVIVLFTVWMIYSIMPSKSDVDYTINYKVDKGTPFNLVLKDLEKSKIIRSYRAAKIIQTSLFFTLKQGSYQISPNMSTWQILQIFHKGADPLVRITFPEGFSMVEIAARLQRQGFDNTQDFLTKVKDPVLLASLNIPATSVEGYLFPSTYFIPTHISSQDMIKLMVKTFMEKTQELRKGKTPQEIQKTVTLASIIEKEAVTDKDRPLIASVFVNRINKNMKLESCATVIYIFEEQGIKKSRLFFKDLKVESPYNTYKNPGLTPGPISNPGIESLKAAFHPATSPYLFFVYKGNGEHIFSENYADHMKAYKDFIQYQYMKKN